MQCGIEGTSIGVIAPFRAQVDLLRNYLSMLKQLYGNKGEAGISKNLDIEINTVDQYQGKDKDVSPRIRFCNTTEYFSCIIFLTVKQGIINQCG